MHMPKKHFHKRKDCRICGGRDLVKVLDLGVMPPANAFLTRDELKKPEERFPLAVYFCNTCSLVQLLDVVDPEILFRDYDYLTSASKPLVDHFVASAAALRARFISSQNDFAVEIGGNDGVLLGAIVPHARVLSVDPAANVATLAAARGVETLNDFFTSALAGRIVAERGVAQLVLANNVMAHIDNVADVFRGVHALLADTGAFVFEAHWVGNLINGGGFDQIYHEHLCYYSLTALMAAAKRAGLTIFDVELIPIHGASLRVYMGKTQKATPRVRAFLAREKRLGLRRAATFARFGRAVKESRATLKMLLASLTKKGKTIAGYGAPAKGNTLLNYYRIAPNLVRFITDTTPMKQGRYTPGTHIPVVAPEELSQRAPDYLLLLAWNYADAIIKKEKAFRDRGGKFIIPVPRICVV